MNKEKQSLFQRIRNAKQSLENAEKSFQDDKGMRGELDLMLAEAELKNLRKKQTFPWSWNRNSFALGIAALLVVSGFCGWLYAKEDLPKAEAIPASASQGKTDKQVLENINNNNSNVSSVQENKNAMVPTENDKQQSKLQLSQKDMRKLVRSAKSELSSGK